MFFLFFFIGSLGYRLHKAVPEEAFKEFSVRPFRPPEPLPDLRVTSAVSDLHLVVTAACSRVPSLVPLVAPSRVEDDCSSGCASANILTASSSTQAIWIGLKISRRRQIGKQLPESCFASSIGAVCEAAAENCPFVKIVSFHGAPSRYRV